MARKKGFLESRGFKLFMKYLYGIGAAVVIGGALFKIMHWPGANQMLIAGMGTEVLVFFVSAFEPLHEELDWARVYPQLAEEDNTEDDLMPLEETTESGMSAEEAMALADENMKEIEINAELFESLQGSLTGLKDNVDKLNTIQDATVATNEYTDNVRNASAKMGELNSSYQTTVDAMSNLSSSVGSAAENADAYHQQVKKATESLASLNAVYEMELQDAKAHIQTVGKFYDSLGQVMANMVEASKDAESYRSEVATLTTNLKSLNKIYGGMLSAMGSGINNG